MSKGTIMGLAVLVLTGILIALSMRGVRQVQCDVCITFKGETVCRTGEGRTKEDAQRTAATAACAVLPTTNMAERVRCSETEPSQITCR